MKNFTRNSVFLCPLLVLFFIADSNGQAYFNQRMEYIKANSVWVTGSGGGLDFNTSPPAAITTASNMLGGGEGCASVADPVTGELLFYSDGETIWNADNEVMQYGDSLMGNSLAPSTFISEGLYGYGGSATQGVCIVPFINQPGKYYLFSLNGPTNWYFDGPPDTPYLWYSVIDMSLDGGLGAVVPGQKNIPLGDMIPLSESMIAVPGDNCDVWLVVHDYLNPVFSAYHISSAGVDPDPVISVTGEEIAATGGFGAYFVGGMAITSDRQVLGITSLSWAASGSGVLLCRFNPATGAVSDAIQFDQGLMPYTMAFSSDNTKLYLGNTDPFFTEPTALLQYDISIMDSASIAASRQVIQELSGTLFYLKSYQGKVYVLSDVISMGSDGGFYSQLTIVNKPNLAGTACNAQDTVLSTYLGVCLPNDVVYAFQADTAAIREDTIICGRSGVYVPLSLSAPEGYYGYVWDDGSEGITRTVTAPGVYLVLCKDSCHSLLDSFVVQSVDIPLDLGSDTILCNGQELAWDVAVPGGTYVWQDSSTGNLYETRQSGLYWVAVTTAGCTVSDTVQATATDVRQNLGEDVVLCRGEELNPILLQAHIPAGTTATWSDGSIGSSLSLSDTGSYWVTVTAASCTGSDTVTVTGAMCECRTSLPNAFSPNGDGINDIFNPMVESVCPVQEYVLSIYNRYGSRVYVGYRTDEGWNGCYGNGQPADVGTYMYEVKFMGGTKQIPYYFKGDLALIR